MKFSFLEFEKQISGLAEDGYRFITVSEFFSSNSILDKTVVNRIDVDISISKAREIAEILQRNNLRASWYFRFSCPKYNLFDYATINLIEKLKSMNHEIGLHTELIDLEKLCNVNGEEMLVKQKNMFESFYNIEIYGSASHGDITGNNNLDFWASRSPQDFGMQYEAYDEALWNNCRYISDSEWVRWKSYDNGSLKQGDHRTPLEHAKEDKPSLIYLLTHPDTYYHKSIHEG